MTRRRAGPLETVFVVVPEAALEAYEAALEAVCETVGFFLEDEDARTWRVEGVREVAADEGALTAALLVAAMASGVEAGLGRAATEAGGWVARTQASFPPIRVGRRFLVRGTHEVGGVEAGVIALTLDAGLAFGSGEHGSTRGCLRALEWVGQRFGGLRHSGFGVVLHRPGQCVGDHADTRLRGHDGGDGGRILDLGTGSGILAMAAARLLRRRVLATDIEPWSVRVAGENARANGVGRLVRPVLADGWRSVVVRAGGPYGLVLANILARPLCRMAGDLAANLAPGGRAILAGLLDWQVRWVLAAHRRHGLVLERRFAEGSWVTLVVRRRG